VLLIAAEMLPELVRCSALTHVVAILDRPRSAGKGYINRLAEDASDEVLSMDDFPRTKFSREFIVFDDKV